MWVYRVRRRLWWAAHYAFVAGLCIIIMVSALTRRMLQRHPLFCVLSLVKFAILVVFWLYAIACFRT